MLLINACRKTDIKPEQVQNNELASKFFNSHTSTDPHIQALNKFLKAKNEKYNFIRGIAVSYTHLRAHETVLDLVCSLLLEKKKRHTELITI